jgi:ubiquinone biosynthesis protein COQ4
MDEGTEHAQTAPPRKMEWSRAWKALKILVADAERTDQVFEIIDALSGRSFERCFAAFAADPGGVRLLRERPSLLATLSDREALEQLPPDSFGRAYADFMKAGNLTADGLVEADEEAERNSNKPPIEVDPDLRFFGDRNRDMHDLWHVLTGYGRDEAGEAANLAFTQAQLPTPGIALIVLAAAVLGPKDSTLSWPRYLYAAWRRGTQTSLLTAAPYEELLPLPLDEVRRRLGVPPASEAHPGGILVANRIGEGRDFNWSTAPASDVQRAA